MRASDTTISDRAFPCEGKYAVYGLASAKTPEIIEYVGFTARKLNLRYNNHISKSKNYLYPKDKRIKNLLDKDDQLLMMVLEDGIPTYDDACERKQHYIAEFSKLRPLKNRTKGGKGTLGRVVSNETRQRHS